MWLKKTIHAALIETQSHEDILCVTEPGNWKEVYPILQKIFMVKPQVWRGPKDKDPL